MTALRDLTGKRFGRLVAIRRCGSKNGSPFWECVCDCGNVHGARSGQLLSGSTASCGCLAKELVSARQKTHGLSRSHHLYRTWASMRNRCNNPSNPQYSDYGGRGILVCDRWNDFPTFIADVGERPAGKTLDRINNDGDYEPSNVRWATKEQQGTNRRSVANNPLDYVWAGAM